MYQDWEPKTVQNRPARNTTTDPAMSAPRSTMPVTALPKDKGLQDRQSRSHDSAGEAHETEDYARFKQSIYKKTGIDLNLYKQHQMHRRLRSMLDRVGVRTFTDYYALMERDPNEYAQFLDRMTINVSELFRNPEKWQEMREIILPLLTQRTGKEGHGRDGKGLKVWSAGCSYGAEPYTLAILLDQALPGMAHTIHASDLDRTILARAKEGRFTVADVKNVPPDALTRYFTRLSTSAANLPPDLDACYQVNANVRSKVSFQAQNLLADRFDTGYDLICCRNVVIYFTDDAKDKLYARFCQALRPGGILFVGGTERIFNYKELGFDTPLPFFYQREDTTLVSRPLGRK